MLFRSQSAWVDVPTSMTAAGNARCATASSMTCFAAVNMALSVLLAMRRGLCGALEHAPQTRFDILTDRFAHGLVRPPEA